MPWLEGLYTLWAGAEMTASRRRGRRRAVMAGVGAALILLGAAAMAYSIMG